MRVALCLDDLFLHHEAPAMHPERPDRLRAIRAALDEVGLIERCARLPPTAATMDELLRVHDPAHLEQLARTVPAQAGYLDPDTYFSRRSWDVALAAAGSAIAATRAVLHGEHPHAAVFIRPPGHHAETDRAMGFCLLGNVAAAAAAARADGARRVAIVDWDVHHGNGTQQMFWRDPTVLYFSVHQYPFYPGSGANGEIGGGEGIGTTINVPLPPGMGNSEYLHIWDALLLPALRAFDPDLILVSAGYDAHRDDPLGQMELDAAGFAALTGRLRALGRPIVAVLEGGYDLGGLGSSAAATVDCLLGAREAPTVSGRHPAAVASCERTRRALAGTVLGDAIGAEGGV